MPDPHNAAAVTAEQRFAQLVRDKREANGWSQEELARRVSAATGIPFHQTGITRIEGGRRNIRLNEVVVLAQALGIDLGVFEAPDPDDADREKDILSAIERVEHHRQDLEEQANRLQVDMDHVQHRYQTVLNKMEKANADLRQYRWMLEDVRRKIESRSSDGER